jgi:asparagine synthase (glutamine-hydrolysing)
VSGPCITGEVRLDNRNELVRSLPLDAGRGGRSTDLELVLAAFEQWGDACVARLLGDFAFVIRDDRTGRSFGARDHFGAKPFYYRATGNGLAFATRASAVADVDGFPLELDERRVADACVPALECADRTSTFYRGILRLPPAHRLTFQSGRVTTEPYWTPDPVRELRLRDDDEYVEAFREVFAEAVRCRLDGPAAAMLSGGLDSSSIVGFARTILRENGGPALATLSAVTDDPGCEESHHIRAVLALPGLDPLTLRPDDASRARGAIASFIASIEDPFDGAMVLPALIYAAAKARGFSAVLDGVDGDTVASHEPDILARLLRARAWAPAAREARGLARFYRGTYEPWSSAARLLGGSAVRAAAPAFLRRAWSPIRQRRAVRAAISESILRPEFAERACVPDRLRALWSQRDPHLALDPRERQAEELMHPQIASALERYHRVAASQGIEARHPFFDKRVAEFCLAIPWEQKLRDGWTKRIVRRATAGLLPDEVRWRRGRWVRLGGDFLRAAIDASGDFLTRELGGEMEPLAPYVDPAKVRALFARHRLGDIEAGETLWAAAVLSSWLRNSGSKRYDLPALENGLAALPRLPLVG